MGLLHFFSYLYRSYTLLLGVWYGSSATCWDWDEIFKSSIKAVDISESAIKTNQSSQSTCQISETNISMKHKKNHHIRILNQDDQPTQSTCQCPKWKLKNSRCAIKRRVPTDQLIKRHICFILSSSLTLLYIPGGVTILWTLHFGSCIFHSMASSIFIWKWFYLLKKMT